MAMAGVGYSWAGISDEWAFADEMGVMLPGSILPMGSCHIHGGDGMAMACPTRVTKAYAVPRIINFVQKCRFETLNT